MVIRNSCVPLSILACLQKQKKNKYSTATKASCQTIIQWTSGSSAFLNISRLVWYANLKKERRWMTLSRFCLPEMYFVAGECFSKIILCSPVESVSETMFRHLMFWDRIKDRTQTIKNRLHFAQLETTGLLLRLRGKICDQRASTYNKSASLPKQGEVCCFKGGNTLSQTPSKFLSKEPGRKCI